MKILTLTDHKSHSFSNSIYRIVPMLAKHPGITRVDVASRHSEENKEFFNNLKGKHLYVRRANSKFKYDDPGTFYERIKERKPIENYDAIFLRLPHPVTDEFLKYLISFFPDKRIINRPSGILESRKKSFLLNFPDVCPPMRLCVNANDLLEFAMQFPIVLKPLEGYGGKGISRIKDGLIQHEDGSIESLEKFIRKWAKEWKPLLAMKYLKNVSKGDKRIVVVDGKIVSSNLRLPAEGNWLCNASQGGRAVPSDPDEDEKMIIKSINKQLKKRGILIYGMDTLVNDDDKRVLSELNTLSVGGIGISNESDQWEKSGVVADLIFKYLKKQF